ncbi:MAG: hypothetical protein LC659_15390, partial [Myxococcales bacterium]|nr:hypothetical protein [Myxococcales bacterium]
RWVLRLDAQRFVYLDVDDVPYVVRSARWQGDRAVVRLSDDSEEELAYDTLQLRGGTQPYCCVKSGRFEARVSTLAWNTLAERIEDGALLGVPIRST